jgi:hypothetical protein
MPLLPEKHGRALRELCGLLPLGEVNWALTGSAGHRLQGVDVPVHDIDVQTDEASAHTAARALDAHTVQPLAVRESQLMWSLFGIFQVCEISIEVMGGIRKRLGADEPWGPATDPAEHRCLVNYQGLIIPVLSLAYEAVAYEQIGRPDRARALREAASATTTGEASCVHC